MEAARAVFVVLVLVLVAGTAVTGFTDGVWSLLTWFAGGLLGLWVGTHLGSWIVRRMR